jgi:hypothetical protein
MQPLANATTNQSGNALPSEGSHPFSGRKSEEMEFVSFCLNIALDVNHPDPKARIKDRRNTRSKYRYSNLGHVN